MKCHATGITHTRKSKGTFMEENDLLNDTTKVINLPTLSPEGVDADALADMKTFSSLQEKRKKAKRKKTITLIIVSFVVLVLIVVGGAWLIGSMTTEPVEDLSPQTTFVERGLFLDEVSASGNLKPVSSVIATPEVEGLIGEVYVSEGDSVTAGQALYTIINADLDKAIVQAEQGITEAYNAVQQAQIALEDARRARNLGVAAAEANPEEVFDVGGADSAIRLAELSLSSAWTNYANAEAAYNEAVAIAAKRTVTSPINGSIVAVNIEPGQSLAGASGTGTNVPVQIADLSRMLVSVEVNEVDILKIELGQTAQLSFSALPDLALEGTVNRIATVNSGASSDMGMGGTVTYAVEILIETPDPRLKPGMTAKATVESKRIDNTLMVSLSAITMISDTQGFVYVINPEDPEDIREVEVEILASNGLTVAIKGELSEGDELLIAGGGQFDEGMVMDDSVSSSESTTVVTVG